MNLTQYLRVAEKKIQSLLKDKKNYFISYILGLILLNIKKVKESYEKDDELKDLNAEKFLTTLHFFSNLNEVTLNLYDAFLLLPEGKDIAKRCYDKGKLSEDSLFQLWHSTIDLCNKFVINKDINSLKKGYMKNLLEVAEMNSRGEFNSLIRMSIIVEISIFEHFFFYNFIEEYDKFRENLPIKNTRVVTEFEFYEEENGELGLKNI